MPRRITLKTSSEWEIVLGILVLDPDGWDRKNLAASWSEFIDQREFERRAGISTIALDPDHHGRA